MGKKVKKFKADITDAALNEAALLVREAREEETLAHEMLEVARQRVSAARAACGEAEAKFDAITEALIKRAQHPIKDGAVVEA